MKIQNTITITVRAIALSGAFSLVAVNATQAAFVPLAPGTPETPGVVLDPNTAGLTGTVIATHSESFVDNAQPTPFASGILKSFVVDTGSGLDFYYQLTNTSGQPGGAPGTLAVEDFFRIKSIGGFDAGLTLSVAQTNDISGLTAGLGSGFNAANYVQGGGLEDASTADRDVATPGSVGFSFSDPPAFIGDPENVSGGETGTLLVIRTNASTYGLFTTEVISGSATSFATVFSAVPEPGSMVFAFGVLGACLLRNRRNPSRSA
jgi:hypothetical protein